MNAAYLASFCMAGLAVHVATTGPWAFRTYHDREFVWWVAFWFAVAASVVAVATMAVA